MKALHFSTYLIFGLLISACQTTDINQLQFLEGKRITDYNHNTVIETWSMENDTLIGKRYYAGLLAGDTTLKDIFKIYGKNKLTLEWTNPEEINPYFLHLNEYTDSTFTFTNEQYAYPSQVVLGKRGPDSTFFRSFGKHGVVPKGLTFVFGSE